MRFCTCVSTKTEIGTLVIKSEGDPGRVGFIRAAAAGQRRSLVGTGDHPVLETDFETFGCNVQNHLALIEPGSCFSGFLAEFIFAADRAICLTVNSKTGPARSRLSGCLKFNFGPLPMANGITRLQTRFLGEPKSVDRAKDMTHQDLDAAVALKAGLVTYAPDDIDWDDEIRLCWRRGGAFLRIR